MSSLHRLTQFIDDLHHCIVILVLYQSKYRDISLRGHSELELKLLNVGKFITKISDFNEYLAIVLWLATFCIICILVFHINYFFPEFFIELF